MNIVLIVFRQILMMFIMMSIGAFCYKIKFISRDGSKTLSDVALFIVLPCVVFTSFQIQYDRKILYDILISFSLAFAAHLIAMGVAYLLVKNRNEEHKIIERFHVIYPNCGFMGVPIAQAMFGDKGVIYITAFMCAQNFLIWSHGVSSMQGGFKKESLLSILKAPVIIALIIGILCFVFGITLPPVVVDSLKAVGNMNTPLAMIVSGTAIAQTNIIKALAKPRIYWMLFLRLLAVPVITVYFLSIVSVSETIRLITVLGISAPTAAISTMFAVKYQKDVGYVAELFAISTLCAIITMPLMISLAKLFF
ncbi:AEC family transporter [Anaerostipes faecalis]|uniref:AEC family transporter n=1 Tax=Anaerostipes faecalis TaxID=2738446 RepID=UPI003F06D20B